MVKVYMEKPVEGGFKSAVCMLPNYQWSDISGYDKSEMAKWKSYFGELKFYC